MFIEDLVLSLQALLRSWQKKDASDCLTRPDCGCKNPGKEIDCENCGYLEACLSHASQEGKNLF
jgi:hypothetical protein